MEVRFSHLVKIIGLTKSRTFVFRQLLTKFFVVDEKPSHWQVVFICSQADTAVENVSPKKMRLSDADVNSVCDIGQMLIFVLATTVLK